MSSLQKYYKQSATYKIFTGIFSELNSFLETLGKITMNGVATAKFIIKGDLNFNEISEHC